MNFWFKFRYFVYLLVYLLGYLGLPFYFIPKLILYFINPDQLQYGWGIFAIIWIITCIIVIILLMGLYQVLRNKFQKFNDYIEEIERYREN